MNIHHRSYFWRLFTAFFAGGFLPFVALSTVLMFSATKILETAFQERAKEAVAGSALLAGKMLTTTASLVGELAATEAVVEYADIPLKTSWLISEVKRLFASRIPSRSLVPFIIPADGSIPISRETIPEEYSLPRYKGWGILGELTRGGDKQALIFFAQPHPLSRDGASIAIGTRIYRGNRFVGYFIIDISRQAFSDQIGSIAYSGAALTELFLTDSTGCIIYNMSDPQKEATFFDSKESNSNKYFIFNHLVLAGIDAHGMFPKLPVFEYSKKMAAATLLIAGISVVLFLCMTILLSQSMARPIHMLSLTMDRVSHGKLDAFCPEPNSTHSGDEIVNLIKQFNSMIIRINTLVENKLEQERSLRRAEIQVLRAQINPHFLYNTLNSIRSVARLDGHKQIASVATSLAKIIREGASAATEFCSLEHSIELARDYFEIESWRWPGRFKLEEKVDDVILNARIPRLIIQPIIENALFHGLERKPGNGTLCIRGELLDNTIVVSIADDGAGIDEEQLIAIRAALRDAEEKPIESSLCSTTRGNAQEINTGNGIALINTHRRLRLIYGLPYGIDIRSEKGKGTTVTIRFPFSMMET